MVNCSFCGEFVEKGTGKIYVKKDGVVFNFCSRVCEKNQLQLGRIPSKVKWTKAYQKIKEIMHKEGKKK